MPDINIHRFNRPHGAVIIPSLSVAMALLFAAGTTCAAPFTISTASTAAQTLGTGAGQTGTITDTGSLAVSGGTVAVTISGNNATMTNLGILKQTGTGRAIRDNTGVAGLTVTNGSVTNSSALMQTADGDVIQMNVGNASVTLHNYGLMTSLNASAGGSQAVDFSAITSGANIINNYATGIMQASEADAVRPGVNGVVYNAGLIRSTTTTGSSSDGVDVQSNTGAQITNDMNGTIQGARHGITGGPANATVVFTTSITNNMGGTIKADNGAGINLDGFNGLQSATIVNHGTILGNGITGDGDAVDVDGLVTVNNTGIIRSLNAFNPPAAGLAFSEAMTVGGGTITNSGTIEGLVAAGNTNAVGRGITLAGNDITTGPLAGTREAIYGNATITNLAGGVIRGQTDSAIVVEGPASGFTVTVNNAAGGTIQGGGLATAAIQTGADNDAIINAGTINGASSGKAIDLGAGNDSVKVTGGGASIFGNISGGTGTNTATFDLGVGNTFSYAGSLSNFDLVVVASGEVTLSGSSTYAGTTRVTGGTLILDGANRISSNSALDLNGGTLEIENAGGANGQTFARLLLSDNSIIDLDFSTSLTFDGLGTIVSGKTLTIVDYARAISPYYAFRLLGDFSGDATFLSLINATTIGGLGARFRFDGTFTDVVQVPEPSSHAVFGLAGVLLLAFRRRPHRGSSAFALQGH